MRISGFTFSASAAVLALMAAQPAWATKSQAEFTGTATVIDATGFTGPANTTYNTTFDLTFFMDDSPNPGITIVPPAPSDPFSAIAGVVSNSPASQIKAEITFGYGGDLSFGHDYGPPDGSASGEVARGLLDPTAGLGPGGALEYQAGTSIFDPDFSLAFDISLLVVSPTNFGQAGIDYNKPFTYTFGPDDQLFEAGGSYRISCSDQSCLETDLTFTLNPETLTVTSDEAVSGGVPEPTTWALMLVGFGGLGAALRRRRQGSRGQVCRLLLQTS